MLGAHALRVDDRGEAWEIQCPDVVGPPAGDPGREFRIRCVVRPDKAQALFLNRPRGPELPERLRILPSLRGVCCKLGGLSVRKTEIQPFELRKLG